MKFFLYCTLVCALCVFHSTTLVSQETGIASFYSDGLKGLPMAGGGKYNPEELTCAHKTLPFGTLVKISRLDAPEHSVLAIVTDRGPFVKGRIIDVSRKAAKHLNLLRKGIAEVVVSVVKMPEAELAGD